LTIYHDGTAPTAGHGTESCPACGGVSVALGRLGSMFYSRCRNCNNTHGRKTGNKLDDFLAATVNDYDEN
jgi:hypothetical protein